MIDNGSLRSAGNNLDPWFSQYAQRTAGLAASEVRALFAVASRPEVVSLAGGMPYVSALPEDLVVGAMERVMREHGIRVSLFIDPDPEQIEMSANLKAPWIELHTGAYANAYHLPGRAAEFSRLVAGAKLGHRLGLVVNAGHGINYVNIAEVRTIPHLHELNIGHSIISRALFTGIEEAVRTMKQMMNS